MRTPASKRSSAPILLGALTLMPLAACATQETPLGTTQWQVTRIATSDATRSSLIPETQQGRAFLVFGDKDFTGASGCVSFRGHLEWLENKSVLRFEDVSTETRQDTKCSPSDEDNAERMKQVLADHDLNIVRPNDTTLRLELRGGDQSDWQTKPALEMISGPSK